MRLLKRSDSLAEGEHLRCCVCVFDDTYSIAVSFSSSVTDRGFVWLSRDSRSRRKDGRSTAVMQMPMPLRALFADHFHALVHRLLHRFSGRVFQENAISKVPDAEIHDRGTDAPGPCFRHLFRGCLRLELLRAAIWRDHPPASATVERRRTTAPSTRHARQQSLKMCSEDCKRVLCLLHLLSL